MQVNIEDNELVKCLVSHWKWYSFIVFKCGD